MDQAEKYQLNINIFVKTRTNNKFKIREHTGAELGGTIGINDEDENAGSSPRGVFTTPGGGCLGLFNKMLQFATIVSIASDSS